MFFIYQNVSRIVAGDFIADDESGCTKTRHFIFQRLIILAMKERVKALPEKLNIGDQTAYGKDCNS